MQRSTQPGPLGRAAPASEPPWPEPRSLACCPAWPTPTSLPCPAPPCPAWPCPALPCPAQPVLNRPVLPCLSFPTRPCPASLSCPTLPRNVPPCPACCPGPPCPAMPPLRCVIVSGRLRACVGPPEQPTQQPRQGAAARQRAGEGGGEQHMCRWVKGGGASYVRVRGGRGMVGNMCAGEQHVNDRGGGGQVCGSY